MILAMACVMRGFTPVNQFPNELCRLYARSMPIITPACAHVTYDTANDPGSDVIAQSLGVKGYTLSMAAGKHCKTLLLCAQHC